MEGRNEEDIAAWAHPYGDGSNQDDIVAAVSCWEGPESMGCHGVGELERLAFLHKADLEVVHWVEHLVDGDS